MTDPKIRQAILAANQQDQQQSAVQLAAQGAGLAIAQLPVLEEIRLNGSVIPQIQPDGGVKITIAQVGCQRCYSIALPQAWFAEMVERIAEHNATPIAEPETPDEAAA